MNPQRVGELSQEQEERLGKLAALIAGLLLVCGSISAHHGTNPSYGMNKLVTMTGTVTEFVGTNPRGLRQ